jgi:hypothetical protein
MEMVEEASEECVIVWSNTHTDDSKEQWSLPSAWTALEVPLLALPDTERVWEMQKKSKEL